jgi:hypothetical protein
MKVSRREKSFSWNEKKVSWNEKGFSRQETFFRRPGLEHPPGFVAALQAPDASTEG